MFSVRSTPEEFKNITITRAKKPHDYRDDTIFEKFWFQIVFRKRKPGVFKLLQLKESFQKSLCLKH